MAESYNTRLIAKIKNRSKVLDMIRRKEYISRIELSNNTNLTPAAVTDIINELLEKDIINEVGLGDSSGGRKPVMLTVNPDVYRVIGIDIDKSAITIVIADFTCKILAESVLKPDDIADFKSIIGAICKAIDELIKVNNVKKETILGVGIGIPGQIDINTNNIVFAPNIGWHDVDIVSRIKEYTGLPVIVENESQATAYAEAWIGLGKETKSFMSVNIRTGVGSGIFTNGQLYRGITGSAGEIGHTTVDLAGPLCRCGNKGCLETFVSTPALCSKLSQTLKDLKSIEDNDGKLLYAVKIFESNATDTVNIFNNSARYIGIALANVANILNPEKIILGGDFCIYGDLVIDIIRHMAQKRALGLPAKSLKIQISRFGQKGPVLGAASIVLGKAFELSDDFYQFKELFYK